MNTKSARPADLLAALAKPTPSYKRHAWQASLALVTFVALYLLLAAFFVWTAWRLTFGGGTGTDPFWSIVVGICSGFLGVFMLKALVFVKRGSTEGLLEITAAEQPRLFEFLHGLADKAGAPRPHKVFVSPRVNAAVFYDLSVLNLLLPSRKNLEIGLGLVNSLSLGELRAVLAHEFGHFAQRSMAVGRWVYVAHQIAAHLIARRDALDDLLNALSRFDLRVAWVGWILRIVVWSIRSLVETAFKLVLLVERALSREMEMNADLVAVSLTGSDALIHALHKLQGADDSWDRTLGFVFGEKAKERFTRDAFAVQTRVAEHMREILDPGYARAPELPASEPQAHRVFKGELAQPPQMWLTHPLNHEREANAKRRYVRAPIDERSAWELFVAPDLLRERVSAQLLGTGEAKTVEPAESLAALDKQFSREFFDCRYRGVYLGRSVVRCVDHPARLVDVQMQATPASIDALYPQSLTDDIEQLRRLERELGQLRALHEGTLAPPEGVIRHRGRRLQTSQLPATIAKVEAELAAVEGRLNAHDSLCRSVHRSLARQLGGGWEAYLEGLLRVLHYADHFEADLRDAQGLLANTVHIATAARRVSDAGRKRIVESANELHRVLAKVFDQRHEVKLDGALAERLGAESWDAALGSWELPPANEQNIGDWLKAIDGWVAQAAGACGALRSAALEQLLLAEAQVARCAREGVPIEPAAAPSVVGASGTVLLPGRERKRQTQLDWWSRFQAADGKLASLLRFGVSAAIVGAVLGVGYMVGEATITVYNGLARPVRVQIGDSAVDVSAHASATRSVPSDRDYRIETRTVQGELIEAFDAGVRGSTPFVYNVAGATPLVQWTAVYGGGGQAPAERKLGAPRWSTPSVDVLFTDPPQSVRSKGPSTREVLSGGANLPASQQMAMLKDDAERRRVAAVHARWDPVEHREAAHWHYAASDQPGYAQLLSLRLKESPHDTLLLRIEQDTAGDRRPAVCEQHRAQAAAAPANANLQYAAARCLADATARDQAFVEGHQRWPQHAWFAYAAGYTEAGAARWQAAVDAMERAARGSEMLANLSAADIARIRRLLGTATTSPELLARSGELRFMVALETGKDVTGPLTAYTALARGQLDAALKQPQEDADQTARLLRLVAASDGASGQLQARSLALPVERGLDRSTVFAAAGLALRHGRDAAPYFAQLKGARDDDLLRVQRFAEVLRDGNSAAAERELAGVGPEVRGQAYSLGVIVLGERAPKAWRDAAKRLLFASERPYFS